MCLAKTGPVPGYEVFTCALICMKHVRVVHVRSRVCMYGRVCACVCSSCITFTTIKRDLYVYYEVVTHEGITMDIPKLFIAITPMEQIYQNRQFPFYITLYYLVFL